MRRRVSVRLVCHELDAVAERIIDERAQHAGEVDIAPRRTPGGLEPRDQELELPRVAHSQRGVGLEGGDERIADADVPPELSWPFVERDGTRGRLVVAMTGTGFDLWHTEDLERFGCTLEVDPAGGFTDDPGRLSALIRYEAGRARTWYEQGDRLVPMLDRRSAACAAAMAGIYRCLLDPDAGGEWTGELNAWRLA